MEEEAAADTRRRVRRATGAVLALSSLCICAVILGHGQAGGKGTILDIKQLAPLQSLHWVNHEFRKVRPAEYQLTPLEQADRTAEQKARTAAKWGSLAATKDVFMSKDWTAQMEAMKENAKLSEGQAERLTHDIQYEGNLLKVGSAGTASIIAQAALAARDASFLSDPADRSKDQVLSLTQHDGSGRTFHNPKFVKVYPQPFHYNAATAGKKHAQVFQSEETGFLRTVNHEMAMKELASSLKLNSKSSLASTEQDAKKDDDTDGVLESRTDMDNGVDASETAAAAKRLATSRVAKQQKGITTLVELKKNSAKVKDDDHKKEMAEHDKEVMKSRLDWSKANLADDSKVAALKKALWAAEEAEAGTHAKVAVVTQSSDAGDAALVPAKDTSNLKSSDHAGLLDNKDDMDNGVDTKSSQEAAKTLANALVDTMQKSTQIVSAKAKADDEEMKMAEHDKNVMKSRLDWSKANPADESKVAALKKALWAAEEAETMHATVARQSTPVTPANESANLKSSDDAGLLDNKGNMDNGVNTKSSQEAAKTLANALVDTMQKSAKVVSAKSKADDEKMKMALHDKEVVKSRLDWSEANPADDSKVAALKKALWAAEEAETGARAKVVPAALSSSAGDAAAASDARMIKTSDASARGTFIATAMKSAVTNAVKTIVHDMSTQPTARKAKSVTTPFATKVSMSQQIEAKALDIEAATSKLQVVREPTEAPRSHERDIIASQLRQRIREVQRDELSHSNAAQLVCI